MGLEIEANSLLWEFRAVGSIFPRDSYSWPGWNLSVGIAHRSGEAGIRTLLREYEMFNIVNIAFLILNFGPWSARLLLASWNKISGVILNLRVYWSHKNLSFRPCHHQQPSCRHPWRRQQQLQRQLAFSADKVHIHYRSGKQESSFQVNENIIIKGNVNS